MDPPSSQPLPVLVGLHEALGLHRGVAHMEDPAGVGWVGVVAVGKVGAAEGGVDAAQQGTGAAGEAQGLLAAAEGLEGGPQLGLSKVGGLADCAEGLGVVGELGIELRVESVVIVIE